MKDASIKKAKEQTQEIYIYKEDVTKFLKIIPHRGSGTETFTFLAFTEKARMNLEPYLLLRYEIAKENPFYSAFFNLIKNGETNHFYSLYPLEEGNTQFRIEHCEEGLTLYFIKELKQNIPLEEQSIRLTLAGGFLHCFFEEIQAAAEEQKPFVFMKCSAKKK